MAILDQGLFAGSHFVLNILLARWLLPSEYGAFATAYAIFLLLAAFHHALIVEPMMVLGAGRFTDAYRPYLRRLLRLHAAFIPGFGLLTLVAAVAWIRTEGHPFTGALMGLAVSGLFVLIVTLLRRALFTEMRTAWSAAGGACYAAALLSTVLLLRDRDLLSPLTALLAMGGAAFVTTWVLFLPLRSQRVTLSPGPSIQRIVSEHWGYGRWALGTVVPVWVSGNVYYLLLPFWVGLDGTGEFRAIMNLAMPALHSLMAISVMLLPYLVRFRAERGGGGLDGPAGRLSLFYALGAVAYLSVLIPFGDRAVAIMYAGQYGEFGLPMMLLVGSIPLAMTLSFAFAGVLRAAERPDLVFRGHLVAGGTALVVAVPLIRLVGVAGALVSMLFVSLLSGIVMLGLYKTAVASNRRGP